jgi:transcriptional regulator with XRE-family HTH domain
MVEAMGRRSARRGRVRAVEQMTRIAAEVRLARSVLAISQVEMARRAGCAHSTIERIEGGVADVQVSTLMAAAAAAGLDLVLRVYPRPGIRLRDTGQLELVEQLRLVAGSYWRPRIEVAAGDHGRAADLVFYGAEEVVHVEVERRAIDWQAQFRSALQKRECLAAGRDRPVRLVLAIEDTRRNRAALLPHAHLIHSQLPASSRDVLSALRRGQPLGTDGLLWIRRRKP